MPSIEIDASEPLDALDEMLAALEALPEQFADELTEWQVEDMRRRFPQTDQPDNKTAETEVFPRSRTWRKPPSGRHGGRRSTFLRVPRGTRPKSYGGKFRSTRPILRAELFDKLSDRVGALLQQLKVFG